VRSHPRFCERSRILRENRVNWLSHPGSVSPVAPW
jgi:hypothetical protein